MEVYREMIAAFFLQLHFFFNAFRTIDSADKHLHGILKNVPETSFLQNDWMNGICLFMKTETFREVGMFDEKFFMYYEDTDFV